MMRLPPFRYVAARSAREAAALLRDHGPEALPVAGGTDLYPNMKRRQFTPRVLVGLRGLADATGVALNGGLRLGALTTLAEIGRHAAIAARWPSLFRAAGLVASPPLRNAATLGGNLCLDTRCNYYNQTEAWRASVGYCMKKDGDICLVAPGSDKCWALSSTDTAPVLISLGAELTLAGPDGERRLPLQDFYRLDGIQYLNKRPEEIVTAVHVPERSGWRATYRKVRRRGSIDFPVLGVAAALRLHGGVVEEARLVLGAVHMAPVEAAEAAASLRGRPLDAESIAAAAELAAGPARPLDNADLAYWWRKRMVKVEVARALRELAGLPTGDLPPSPHGARPA